MFFRVHEDGGSSRAFRERFALGPVSILGRPSGSIHIALASVLMLTTAMPAAADPPAGTFSIAAFDAATGECGVAVQSRVFGVGPRVAWVLGGAGAIATQAQSNESFGPMGLGLLASGLSARETLDSLLAGDPERDVRQVGIVDARGGVANWTGPGCNAWAGDTVGVAYTCQGNILTGADVVASMERAFRESAGEELGRRLIAALEAGQAAGGDSRGQQSASLLVGRVHPAFPEYAERYIDIRIDDHTEPIRELKRLFEIYEGQGLVQAHTRFAAHFDAAGDSAAARRERERVGHLMERVLRDEKADADVLNALAWFSATNNLMLPSALKAAQRASQLKPTDSNILDTLAEVHYRMGDAAEAIEVESRAIELAPEDAYLKKQVERFRQGRK